ncbi:MAG: glycine cleavage system protein GcvH [Thermoguttaceae bacterium]|nr:glycine cleavage system protein GcvH [Thermoguttaceae bacterium]
MKPEELLYTTTHEWIHVATDPSGAKIGTVGISSFALEALTDLVFIELPQVGQRVQAGRRFGEIESVKAVSDLYSPVDGEIVAVNSAVAKDLEHLADDPYEKGWLIKVRITDESGLTKLMDYAAYQRQCEQEMKDA